jgi:hypothetical protein
MTQIGTFDHSSRFSFQKSSFKFNNLIPKILFGIEIAVQYNRSNSKPNIVDKAKPRAIVGRKATDPKSVGSPGYRSRIDGTG